MTCFHKKLKYFTYSLSGILLGSLCAVSVGATDRMNVGFGATLDNGEIIDFISQNNASPKAAHMWVDGLSGTYRTSEDILAEDFIDMANAESINFFEDSIDSNILHIEEFLKKNSRSDVLENEDLGISARSYLSLNRQLNSALKSVETGHPLIYGVELEGTESELNNASSDRRVSVFVKVNENSHALKDRKTHSVKPKRFKNRAMDNFSASASIQAVYQQLVKISKTKGETK